MNSEPLERKTLSIPAAATILGIGQSRAYKLAKDGKLPGCLEVGGRYLVSKKRLEAFIDGENSEGAMNS